MTRNYNFPDAEMFQTGRTHRAHFGTYKPDFIAFSLLFNDPFDADWLVSIEASEAYETAETRDDQLQQETQVVNLTMAACRQSYIGMKYYIEKVFSSLPAICQNLVWMIMMRLSKIRAKWPPLCLTCIPKARCRLTMFYCLLLDVQLPG